EFLTAAGERRPVKQVEITLGEFCESNQLIDGAESSAETKRTGPFFLHQNGEILATGDIGIFGISLDFCKITQVLETFLRSIHPYGVKDISRRNEHFAPDDLVLGARVPLDIDPVYKRAHAFLDVILHIDQSGTGRRPFRLDHKIDITSAPVSVSYRL